MPLSEYIDKYYGGNQTAFAEAAKFNNRQQVSRMVKNGNYYVYDGMLLVISRVLEDDWASKVSAAAI